MNTWSAYETVDGCHSGFGFGTTREWGHPVFRLYEGDQGQTADVVRKLNSHADLLSALRDALNVLRHAEIIDGTLHAQFMPSDLEQMRAAVAKAESDNE